MAFRFTLHRKKTRPPTEQSSPLGKRQEPCFGICGLNFDQDLLKEWSDGQIVGTQKTSAPLLQRSR